MGKILTAEEFLIINDDKDFRLSMSGRYVSEMMVAFAKVHVEAALKEASENAETEEGIGNPYDPNDIYYVVDKNSILNSYPLTNIK
jgi:hypothetical protein